MEIIGQIIALAILIFTLFIEKGRQNPVDKRKEWIVEMYKKRRIIRHDKMTKGDTDGLSKDFSDLVDEVGVLLKDEKHQ